MGTNMYRCTQFSCTRSYLVYQKYFIGSNETFAWNCLQDVMQHSRTSGVKSLLIWIYINGC